MVLDIKSIPNLLFERSKIDNVGIGSKSNSEIWNCAGINFIPLNTDTDTFRAESGARIADAGLGEMFLFANVTLPDRAVISEVKVFGEVQSGTVDWHLFRILLGNIVGEEQTEMAAAALNTSDKTISNNLVDNENYSYYLRADKLEDGDAIVGAWIKYTV